MLKLICLTHLIIFLSIFYSFAQNEDLSADFPFFEQKTQEYQDWLTDKALSQALQVDHVQYKTSKDTGKKDYTELELILLLRTHDVDSAVGQWNSLKKSFDSPADSLEGFLYRSFVHKMEILPEKGNIQIYIRGKDGQYVPCFYIWIWWENARIKTEKRVQACKNKTFEVYIPPYKVSSTGRNQTTKITQKTHSKDQAFILIYDYIEANLLRAPRYKTVLKDRKPLVEYAVRTGNHYEIALSNLGKEVLTDQTRTFWEKFVRINTIAVERLSFQFDYFHNQNGGYQLRCSIDGKYGSGVFKPRKSGYLNMENDFDDLFETYKNNFRQALLKYLSTRP